MILPDDGDEYFPRGGHVQEIKKKKNFAFERKGQHEPKAKKPGKRERRKMAKENDDRIESQSEIVLERFEPLIYKGLSEGTVTLCCVREIYDNYVDVSLPGRLSARLYIGNVSEPYSKASNKESVVEYSEDEKCVPLKKIFRVGQHLSCSVMGVQKSTHFSVRVSSDPAHVNSQLTFDMIKPGYVIQMAVQSVEDHGYTMFSGVSGLLTFLPSSNATSFINDVCNSQPLSVGQIVWCLVTNSKMTGVSNTVHVTLDFDCILKSKQEEEEEEEREIPIELLNPGVAVDVVVKKIVLQNILVEIKGSKIHGYIEPSHLSSVWSVPEDYGVGTVHTATVLYKYPYARIIALSLKSNPTSVSKEDIPIGTIFEDAEIMSVSKRGVTLKLHSMCKFHKGMVSIRRLGGNFDEDSLTSRFPIGNHIKCRIIGYNNLEQVYSCSTEDKLLNEKYLTVCDLKVGDVVEVTVKNINKSGLEVTVGALKGFVPSSHISDVVLQNPFEKVKLKNKYKGKVFKIDDSNLHITLRPTLVKTPSLTNFQDCKVGDSYFGFVNKIHPYAISVSFFGGLYTNITEENLLEPVHKYHVGELVKCYVLHTPVSGGYPVFSLLKPIQSMGHKVGSSFSVIVTQVSKDGLSCLTTTKGETFNGFIPLLHFCDYPDFCGAEMEKYPIGSVINEAVLLSINEKKPLFSLKQSIKDFFQKTPDIMEGLKALKTDMILPCTVSEVCHNSILVCAPIPGFNGKVPISSKKLPQHISKYSQYEGLLAKVQKVDVAGLQVVLSGILTKVEKKEWSLSFIKNYLSYLKPLQKFSFGSKVECVVMFDGKSKSISVQIPNSNTKGILIDLSDSNYKAGQKVEALVLHHSIKNDVVYLHVDNSNISLYDKIKSSGNDGVVSGTMCYADKYIGLVLLKDSGHVAFIPIVTKRNQMEIHQPMGVRFSSCSITLASIEKQKGERTAYYWIGFNDGIFNGQNNMTKEINMNEEINTKRKHSEKSLSLEKTLEVETPSKKSKINKLKVDNTSLLPDARSSDGKGKKAKGNATKQVIDEYDVTNSPDCPLETSIDNEINGEIISHEGKNKKEKKKKKKEINEINEGHKKKKMKTESSSLVESLEEAGRFDWDVTPKDLAKVVSGAAEDGDMSQESEDENAAPKKLTAKEKRAQAAETERRIREKEEELLIAESNPQSAEHFDRLLTASPNSSKLWILYMAYHMQATEIEKARSVAKRALKHINVRLEDERLNVWIASLNLENLYGTPESFKEVLTEALKYNDDYKVYKRVLDIYADSEKINELEKLVNQLLKKYKDKPDCWLECQTVLMKAGLCDKARKLLQRSLEALPTKEYCTLISRFALVENKFGFAEQAQSLFENLLTSYPKRIDIWYVYIDMLSKSGSHDLARNVLERATSQSLPVRKMKALYQKWLKFEEANGTPESVEKVKEAAANYVNNLKSALTAL